MKGDIMLYLIDDYIAERKKIVKNPLDSDLLKFQECEKFLHEMTLDEINKEVSSWSPVLDTTALRRARIINQYFDWLKSQGQEISVDARDIKFPIKDSSDNFIFSTNDIQKYYDILHRAIEENNVLNGTTTSVDIFNMSQAAGILAFYGLSDEQILELDCSDVQPDGVRGYDLPLTQNDIDVLLRYKTMTNYEGNNNRLRGEKYIRNRVRDGAVTDIYYLNRPLGRIKVSEKYEYLKTLLRTPQLYLFGKFNQVYLEEKKRGEIISSEKNTPKWFQDIFHVSKNWITKRKREYIEYRNARDESRDSANNAIVEQIIDIDSQIAELNQKVEELRKQLV